MLKWLRNYHDNSHHYHHMMQAWATLEGQKGDHTLADDLFKAADNVEPGNPILLNAWASFKQKSRGDSASALQMYADAVSANPDDIRSLQVPSLNEVSLNLAAPCAS